MGILLHQYGSIEILKLFIGIILCLPLLIDGAVAILPPISKADIKPILRNKTQCAPDHCPAVCNRPFHHRLKTSSNHTIPEAATLNESTSSNLQRRYLPPLSQITDRRRYVCQLTWSASHANQFATHHYERSPEGETSMKLWFFPETGETAMGIRRMFGYTAVIAISQRGVSFSIMPETPIFMNDQHVEQDHETFYGLGIAPMRDPRDPSASGPIRSGISLGRILRRGEMMGPEHDPHLFIVTPNTDASARERGIQTPLRWQQKVEVLSQSIEELSGQRPQVIGYERRPRYETTGQFPTQTRPYAGWGARAIVEVDMNDDFLEVPGESGAADSISLASWRLWVEDEPIHAETFCAPYDP